MSVSTDNTYKIILIRHGQTMGNVQGAYIGARSDISLSSEGLLQIEAVRPYIYGKTESAEVVFSSPMKRCLETAKAIWKDKSPVIVNEFREIDFGDFEGKTYSELSLKKEYQSFIDSGGELPFPNGEAKGDFISRCMRGFRKVILQSKNAVIVCHGGTIMAIMSSITGKNYYDFQVANLQGYELLFSFDGDNYYEVSFAGINSWNNN